MSLETIAPGCTEGRHQSQHPSTPVPSPYGVAESSIPRATASTPTSTSPSRRLDAIRHQLKPTNSLGIEDAISMIATSPESDPSARESPEYELDQSSNERPKYSSEQKVVIMYLHVMLDLQWERAREAYKGRHGGDRTVQGLQSEAYRIMKEWNMVQARQGNDTRERKAKNKQIFRQQIEKMKERELVRELERTFGPPRAP
ncbi:hypothetical protein K469DRAFT_110730 [Zopfia rhizophila CBS 207.26]|uniref:Uncharacterized protein n=1 Tax=Zopfia rhizophila CBS 207.26 TaxID=1314779 RepID=A0A6A6E907_9PEZI|nr:hypothetical protein K469DRAFT_110730 [Zopfia rhizophila CBS 207.26]